MPTPPAPTRRFFTLAEAGEITRLSVRTLRRAIAAKALRAHHVGRLVRVEDADLYGWLASQREPHQYNQRKR
jgi:excisionase family DNA binding protein